MLTPTAPREHLPAWAPNDLDHEHVVQLYEEDAFLADTVAGFIATAMVRQEAGVIVATPQHRADIDARLCALGLDVEALERRGQLTFCDAATILREFMLDDMPDSERFRASVGEMVTRAARGETRRVRIFGEMVDLLVAASNLPAALRLEELWAELQISQPFALFCAYPIDRFAGASGAKYLEAVCARHQQALPTERYDRQASADAQSQTIVMLQQQASTLAAEIQARQRSDERLRRQFLANSLPTFIWEHLPAAGPDSADDYLLVEQNAAAERFLGAACDQSVGWRLSQLAPDGPMGALPDLLACAEPDQRVWREHSFTEPETGLERCIQMSLVALPPELAVVFVEDVTDRLEAEQRQMQEAHAEKLQALGQLASGMAHDLNQYLTMIAGCGELVRDTLQREGVSAEALAALDAILQAALDGGETVNQLLRFVRRQPDGAPEPVDVTALLQEVSRLTSPRWRDLAQLEGRPIRLELLANGAHLEVLGHGSGLREALTLLIFNAVDALPCGGDIHLSAERDGDQVHLSVADTGAAMSSEAIGRAFPVPIGNSRSTGSVWSEPGSSAGLAHVRSIVERQGGTMTVQTTEETGRHGATVRLSLPAAPPTRTVAPRQIPTGDGPRLRLLVVDDEPALAQLAAQGLRRAGHQVEALHSAVEALAALDTGQFDVLVTDLGLGDGMNGWELVSLARQQRPDLRVVMVSGWASDIEPSLAAANGVDAVVAKPYQLAKLIQAVEGASIQDGDHTQEGARRAAS